MPPREPLAGARAALSLLASLGGVDAWVVSRMTEDTWTGLVVESSGAMRDRYDVGTPVAVDRTLCHHLLGGAEPAVLPDLGGCGDSSVQRIAGGAGIRGYAGVVLTGSDGRRLGSLAAFSSAPVAAGWDWPDILRVQAVAVQDYLDADIAAVGRARRDVAAGLQGADGATGLPDRQGWVALLSAEEHLAPLVADPVGITLVDVGVLRTVRALRRVVAVVREVSGGAQLARIGPRRLGLLAGGHESSRVAGAAASVQGHLEGAGFRARTVHTMRAGLEPLADTWARAERAMTAQT